MRFAYDLDRALSRVGFDVTVYTSDQLDAHSRTVTRREQLEGIEIRRFPNASNYLATAVPWLSYYPQGLRHALLADGPRHHVIHVAEARGPHVEWAFAAARQGRTPIVWSPLGGLAEGVGIRKPYRRLYDVAHGTRQLIREADVVVAQSAHEAAILTRLGAHPSQVKIIGLGVNGSRFGELPERGTFRRAIGVGPRQPLILFVGRFHPTKGLDVLVRAAALVRRTHADVAVALVGWDHGSLAMVKRVIASTGMTDATRIVAPLFGPAAVRAYVDADVFAVAANVYEETSLAAMEALAAGTPCVLTRQCEIPGLEEMGGGVVTDCEPEAFAAGLLGVLGDRGRTLRPQAARGVILGSRTTEQIAGAYAGVFRELAQAAANDRAQPTRVAR